MPQHLQVNPFNDQNDQQIQSQSILSPSEIVLFSRINNYLLFHFVPLIQFWTTQRLCVTIDQFQKMLQKIRFFKGKQEIQQMKQKNTQFITLDKLLLGVNQWKRHQIDIPTFLQKQQQYSADKLKQESQLSPNKKRIKSKYEGGILELNSQTQIKSQRKSLNKSINGGNSRVTNASNKSNSHMYLIQNSKKQQDALLQLNQTLIRTKNQSHYQLAIKVGELNDICKKLKNDLSYVISTKQGGEIQIQQKSNKSDKLKQLSQKMFERRYEQLKTLNNNMMQQSQGTLQKDLRQTLVQVMYLSDQLQKQIALLKRKGINS